jgi:hypothetical protein
LFRAARSQPDCSVLHDSNTPLKRLTGWKKLNRSLNLRHKYRLKLPAKPMQINPPVFIKPYTFGLQHPPLNQPRIRIRQPADFTSGINHPVPGDIRVLGQHMEGISDQSCMAGQPGLTSNLAIGSNTAAGNLTDCSVDFQVGRFVVHAFIKIKTSQMTV